MHRSIYIFFTCLPLLLLSSGCQTPTPRTPEPVEFPETWQESGATDSSISLQSEEAIFWEAFDDPRLEALIEEALQAHPTALKAFASLREARLSTALSEVGLRPTLSLGAGHQHRYDLDSKTHSDSSSLSLDAAWEVDLWGKLSQEVSAAEWREKAVEADLEAIYLTLAAEVAHYYVAILADQSQLYHAEESAQIELEMVELERARYESGRTHPLTLQKLERSYQQTLSSIPPLKQRIIEGRRTLALLLGRLPQSLEEVIPLDARTLPSLPSALYLPIPAEGLRRRPDLLAAERRLYSATAQCHAISANRWPSLSLQGQLGRSSSRFSDIFNLNAMLASLSARLSYALYDSGQSQKRTELCLAQQEQALQSYRQTLSEAVKEVENALTGLEKSAERCHHLDAALTSLETEFQWVEIELDAGQRDYTDWLSLSASRLTLQQQRVTAQQSELGHAITLIKAMAGPWAKASIEEQP